MRTLTSLTRKPAGGLSRRRFSFRSPAVILGVIAVGIPGYARGADAPSSPAGPSPAIRLEATVDKDRVALGEPITMTVTARHDEPVQWEPKSVADRLGAFDVRQVSGPETIRREGGGAQGSGG